MKFETKEIKLGDKIRDKITGLEGTAMQVSFFISGCVQIEVLPPLDEKGELRDAVFIDESQLEVVEECEEEESEEQAGGGVRNHPPKRR